jgi:hypothetical protein
VTRENWLTVILIICTSLTTLVAPTVAVLAQLWLKSDKPVKHRKALEQWLSRFINRPLFWAGFPLGGAAIFAGMIIYNLRKSAPITRWSIFQIAYTTGGMFLGFVLVGIFRVFLDVAALKDQITKKDIDLLKN